MPRRRPSGRPDRRSATPSRGASSPSRCRADGPVRMYTCGPTVYRWAHVGNLRSYLLADLIRRTFLYHGVPVLHVKNITDVGHLRDERFDRGEDRMLVAAGLESKSPAEIADAYEAGFHEDEALVNILPAHVFPRATEHVPEMLDLAARLEALGHAYLSASGNLYYAVDSFPDYGRLSGNSLDSLRAGHRSRGRGRQARSGRLRAVEGGRRGPPAPLAEPVGRRVSRLAPRVLGDGAALPRCRVRDPHRRHRQRLPPSRGRDRAVDPRRRRPAGQPLGPRGASARVGPEDGQVDRQLRARHGAPATRASTRSRSAT